MIASIEEGSPAAKAGLLPGDILASLGGRELGSPEELREALAAIEPGKSVKLVILRGGSSKDIEVTVGERSSESRGGQGHHHHGGHGHHHDHGEGGCGCGGEGGGGGGDCGCGKGH